MLLNHSFCNQQLQQLDMERVAISGCINEEDGKLQKMKNCLFLQRFQNRYLYIQTMDMLIHVKFTFFNSCPSLSMSRPLYTLRCEQQFVCIFSWITFLFMDRSKRIIEAGLTNDLQPQLSISNWHKFLILSHKTFLICQRKREEEEERSF